MVTGSSTTSLIMSATGESGVAKRSSSDNRRSNKPIMEKRRRARINNCLNELKNLILDATKKDPARHSKLEKADILEKTVKYLQELQHKQVVMTQAADPTVVNKFKAGFSECAKEVERFPGMDPNIKRRLMQHLTAYMSGVKSEHVLSATTIQAAQLQPVQIHMLPTSPPGSPEQNSQSSTTNTLAANTNSSIHQQHQQILKITTNNPNTGYYLTMPNGMLSYVATAMPNKPSNNNNNNTSMPTLVPIPSRTASTASAASNTSSTYERLSVRDSSSESQASSYSPLSPANSYEVMDYQTSSSSPVSTSSSSQQFHSRHHHHHRLSSTFHHVQSSKSSNIPPQHDDSVTSMDEDDDEGQSSSGCESVGEPRSSTSSPMPLSLVMKRSSDEDTEEQPWRPW